MTDDKAARLAAIRQANQAQRPTIATEERAPLTTTAPASQDLADLPPVIAFHNLMVMLVSVILGALAAVFVLPDWVPSLSSSLQGSEPKAYWYIARSSAFVGYVLLWLSMALGLLMTNKLARVWPGGPTAFDLHQHTSLLGLAFGILHALILMGDRYIAASLTQVLTPFAYTGYEPVWVGIGQIALYGMAIVGLSFYVKPVIGRGLWRLIHFLSFAVFLLVLAHGLMSGSDTDTVWAQGIYWASGGSLIFLTIYRIMATMRPRRVASQH